LYSGGLNHRAAECMARKGAQSIKAAAVYSNNVETGSGSEESGKE